MVPSVPARLLLPHQPDWHPLPLEPWLIGNVPSVLQDQVLKAHLLNQAGGPIIDLVVAEQFPKGSLDTCVQALTGLGLHHFLVLVSHTRSNNSHLVYWSQLEPRHQYHFELNLNQPAEIDRWLSARIQAGEPRDFQELVHFLRSETSHQAFYRATQAQLKAAGSMSTRQHQWLLEMTLGLVFLLFVQKKGWLNFDPGYLETKMLACAKKGYSIQTQLLKPLFARLEGKPIGEPLSLGALPNLGGGLFDLPFSQMALLENQWFLDWYSQSSDAFSFSLFEPHATRMVQGINPEILGHVFENLMDPNDRKKYGVFYTPTHLVQKQVAYSFEAWKQRNPMDFEQKIRNVRILDPACGSGSYLVAALNWILEQRLTFEPDRARYNGKLFELKRNIITQQLFGLDVHPFAVRIAEVRLWLNMIQDLEIGQPELAPALPSLVHHLRCADFLNQQNPPDRQAWLGWRKRDSLERLKREFSASPNHQRLNRFRHILRLEREFQIHCDAYAGQANLIEYAQAKRQKTLPLGFDAPATKLKRSKSETARSFNPQIVYSQVFESGGFDLILGNPPWLASTQIPASSKKMFAQTHKRLGLPFSASADLSVHFFLTSFAMLKEGGHLSMVLPAKFAKASYARPARNFLAQSAKLNFVLDYSDHQDLVFRADTFPIVLGVDKLKPQPYSSVQVEIKTANCQKRFCRSVSDILGPEVWSWTRSTSSNRTLGHLQLDLRRGVVTHGKKWFTQNQALNSSWLPLLRGRDISRSKLAPGSYIYWPFLQWQRQSGQIEEQEERWLKQIPKTKKCGSQWHLPYSYRTFSGWLLIWKYLAEHMTAALIHNPTFIPDQTTYYCRFDSLKEAWPLFRYLNHPDTQKEWCDFAQPGKDHHFFYYAHTVRNLPLREHWDENAQPPPVKPLFLPEEWDSGHGRA
ncbi:MAG: N-6 DNA methylase [Acidobacteria bacterium]|nr:N-6 DNA methylase [Acidobacteriota bacterium]